MRRFRFPSFSKKVAHSRPRTRLQVEVLEQREMPSFGLDASFGHGGLDLNPVSDQAHFDTIAGLTVLNDGRLLAVGNLQSTTDPNGTGDVAVVRYLYAFDGGSLYQPQWHGVRTDKSPSECTIDQLKYAAASVGDDSDGDA